MTLPPARAENIMRVSRALLQDADSSDNSNSSIGVHSQLAYLVRQSSVVLGTDCLPPSLTSAFRSSFVAGDVKQ